LPRQASRARSTCSHANLTRILVMAGLSAFRVPQEYRAARDENQDEDDSTIRSRKTLPGRRAPYSRAPYRGPSTAICWPPDWRLTRIRLVELRGSRRSPRIWTHRQLSATHVVSDENGSQVHQLKVNATLPPSSWQRFRLCVVKPPRPHWFFISSNVFSQSLRSRYSWPVRAGENILSDVAWVRSCSATIKRGGRLSC
jgi:hypothetical protein